MIKKAALFLSIVFLLFALCGCGASKDKLLKDATEFPFEKILKTLETKGIEETEDNYSDSYYKMNARIKNIINETVIFHADNYPEFTIRGAFSKEKIALMENGLYVNVVGKIKSIEKNNNKYDIMLTKAMYIDNISEITGSVSKIDDNSFQLNDKDGKYIETVYYNSSFADDVDVKNYINKSDWFNHFSVNGELFFNGDNVKLTCVRKELSLEKISGIVYLKDDKYSARSELETRYKEAVKISKEGDYAKALQRFENIDNFKDSLEKAEEMMNKLLESHKDTDLSEMQGLWHTNPDCSYKDNCNLINIHGVKVSLKGHNHEKYKGAYVYVGEMKENKLVYETPDDEYVLSRTWYLEDGKIISVTQRADGTSHQSEYYKTDKEVIGSYKKKGAVISSGKKCAMNGCDSTAALTGDSVYCTKHSNRCLECNCYIDADAMYCMSCIKKALKK